MSTLINENITCLNQMEKWKEIRQNEIDYLIISRQVNECLDHCEGRNYPLLV